ncbi:MAG: universal stress protein [SAR202 cluster bacterium]|nr:universal stress protein [SAR202 cluster bacterium]
MRRAMSRWLPSLPSTSAALETPLLRAKKILVPIQGSPIDLETVKLAGEIARRDNGTVYAVHVIEVDRSLPLEEPIEAALDRSLRLCDEVERIATEFKYPIETEVLQARDAAPAIVDEAFEREVDLIFIGLKYKEKFGEYSMGKFVPHVLQHAPCMVCIYRESVSETTHPS